MEPYLKLYEDLKAANVSGLPKTSQAFRDKLLNDEESVYKVLGAVNKLNWDEGAYNLKDTKDANIIREQLGLKKKVATQPSIPFSPDSGTQKLKSFGEQGREELDKPKAEQPLKPVQEPKDFKEIGQEVFPEIKPEAPTPFKIEAGIQQLKSETNQYEDYLKTKVELQPVIEANEKLRGQVFEDLQQNKDAFIDKGRWVVNKDNGKRMWVGGRKTKRPELDMYPDEYYQELDMGKMMDFIKAKYPEQSKRYSSGLEAARMDFMNDFYSKRELTPYRDLASQAARADFIKTTGKPDPGTLHSMIAKEVDAAATEADKQVEVLSYRQGKVSENLNKNYTAAATALSNNFTNIAQQQQQQLIKKYEDAVRTGAVKPEQAQGQFQQEFEALNKSLEDKYKADSEAMYKQYTEDIAKANRDIQKDFTDTVEMPFELKKKEALNKADNFYTDEDKKLLSKLYGQQFKGAQLKLREAQKQQYENKDLGLKTRDLFQAGVSDFMRLTGGMIYNGAEEISQVFSATTGANVSVAPYVRSIGEQMQNQGAKFQQTQEALAQDPDAIWGALVRSTPLTVGMLIPAAFVDAAVAGATKGSSMGWLTRAVVAGMVSRTMESNMEARGAYDEMIAKGESIQKSKEIARGVYEDNQNLMALDILQFGIAGGLVSKTFGKAFSGMSMTATYALERAIDMPTEAFEELYQGYAVAKRENPELSFSDYAVSPEGKVAGATGALMGFAFGTVGDAIRVVRGADQAIQTSSLLKMAQVNFGKNRINQLQSMATTMYQQGAFTPQQYQSIQKKLNLIYSQYESLPEGLHESAKAAVLENLYQMEELRAKQQKALDAGSIDLAEAIGQDIEALKKEIPGILNGKEALYSINGVPFSKEVFGRITAQEGFMDELKAGVQDGTLQFWTTDAAFSDKLRDYKPNPIAKQIEDEDIRQAEEQKQPEPDPQPGLPAGSKAAGEPEKKVKLTDLPKQLQDELVPLGYPEDHEFDNQEQAIEIGFGTKDKYVAPETKTSEGVLRDVEIGETKTVNGRELTFYNIKGYDDSTGFAVEKNKNGYVIHSAMIPMAKQRQGIGTDFYIRMNEESIKNTGKPLRSSDRLSDSAGKPFWEKLVEKGLANKIKNGYEFKSESLLSKEQTQEPKKDETEKEIAKGESKPQPIKELKARKKGKIKDKNRLKLLDLKGLSPKDQVMQYFMSGGKIPRAAIETFFKGDKEEVKRRFQLWSGKEGLTDIKTLDKLAEALAEDQDTPGRYDDTEFKEALEDVLLGHMSASTMQADMMEKFFPEMPEEARMEAQDDIEAEQIADAMVENMSEEDAAELITMLEAAYGTDMAKLEEDMKAGMLFTGLQEVWEKFVENKPMESQAQVEKTITEYIYDKQGKGSRKAKTATKTPEKVQPPKKQREPKPERKQTGKGKDVDDLLDDLGDVLAEPESEYVAEGRQPDYGLFGKPEKGKSDYRKDFEAQKQSMAKDLRKMQSDLDTKRKELIARGATAEDMKRILTPMQQALGVQQQKYIDFEQKGEQSVRQAQQAQTDLFAPVQSNVGQLEFESEGQLPRGEDVIYMERLLEVKTGIDFVSGGVRINSSADTAYLMRHMRSFTSENAYVVLHKADGTADVQYLSSGGTTSAIIDIKMVIAAAVDRGATSITLVHNHPSGNLTPSNNDYKMHSNLTEALEPYGIAVNKSVIIDTDQGLYTEFVSNDYETQKELGQVSGEKKYEVLSFEKQVLYVPSTERDRITSSEDVAQYLSKQKAGTTPAIAMIVLDRANNVNGFFLMDESATDMDILKKAQYEIGKRGEAIILASNRPMGEGNLRYLAKRLDSIGANLLDFVTYKLGDETLKGFKSYRDEGLISEPQEGYGKIKEFARQWNMNQFGYFPQAFDDAKAKIALKKIGNEYGIKRAQSGGYFLTKNGKLYNPYKASSQIVSEPEGPKRIPLETLSKAQDVLSKLYEKGIKDFDEIAKLIGQRLGEEALNKEIADTGSSFLDGLKAAYGMMQSYYSDLTPMDKVRTYKQGQTKKISDDTDTNTSTESNVSGLRPEDRMGQENVWPEQGRVRQGNNPTVPAIDEKSERPDGSIEPTTNLAVVERERNTSGVSTGQPELFWNVPRGTDTGRSRVRGEARKQPEPSPRTGTEKFVDRDGSESQYATKLNQQKQAESIPVEVGNAKNVAETLPFLLDSQVEDVVKAERRLEVDGEKAILFANGTGTGKGLMSLGVVKRYVKQGKGDIVIVVPKQELIDKAIEEGKLLGLDITALQSTSVAGQGVTITTYANLRANTSLQMRVPDLIIFDESQNILENQDGDISSTTQAARKLFSYQGYSGVMKAAEQVLGAKPDGNVDIQAYKDWMEAFDARREEFKTMSEENYQKSKVMLLSATPFSGEKALVYTDGLLHDMSDANAFYIQNFGYRIRYSKLTKPEKDVDQGLMQVTFTDRQIQQGKQSVRMIDVPYDYSRDFMLLESASGNMIDLGLRLLSDEYKLGEVVRAAHKGIYYTRLLEQLKAKLIVPVVQDLVNRGFKVVVFHDYNKTDGVSHPFQTLRGFVKNENEKAQLKRFEIDHPEFMELPLSDLQGVIPAFENSMPQESVFLNGENPTKDAVKLFNDDNSGKDVMVVSSSKGNAGFSMHDTIGTKPRVLINIGLPVRPIFAIQTEGRIYRVGQASNAAFIYPIIGTGFEKYKFARIGERTSSTENLALGSIARNLKDIFIQGYIQAATEINFDALGTGSKEADKGKMQIDTWELAKSLYYGQQKKNSRTKAQEGEDYYATPEPIGLKMVEILDLKPGQKFLEPSAGHGAIARWVPEYMDATAIEPSYVLRPMLQLNAPQIKRVEGYDFMSFPTVNKYNGIAMNPPFGVQGKTAAEHLRKAFDHLKNGGRLVAIVPNGKGMERIMTWLQDTPNAVLRQEVRLPSVTFGRAGTQVSTTMVVIDKIDEKGASEVQKPPVYSLDLSGIEDINELFDEVKEIGVLEKMGSEDMESQRETAEYLYDKSVDFEKGERIGKDGKTYYTAKPKDRIGDRFKSVAGIANQNSGWYGKFSRAFEFKTELDRESFINAVAGMDDTILSEQPGTYEYYDKKANAEEEKLRQALRDSMRDMSANPFASAAAVVAQATKFLAYKILAGVKSLSKALAGSGLVPNDFFRKIWDSLRALQGRMYKQPDVPITTELRGYGLMLKTLPEFKQALNRIYDNQQYKSDMDFLLQQEITAYNTLIATSRDPKSKLRLQTIKDALQVLQANTSAMSAEQVMKYVYALREAQVEKPVVFDYNPTTFASFMMEMFDTLYPQKVVQRQIQKAGGKILIGRDPYTLAELYESKLAAKQGEFNEKVVSSRRTVTGAVPNPSLLERMVAAGIDLGLDRYEADTPIGRFLEKYVREVSGSAYLKFLTGKQPIPTFPEYLHAIHAKERNELVRKRRQEAFDGELTKLNAEYALTQSPRVLDDIDKLMAGKNPDFPLIDDMGSGMSDSDADAVVNELTNNWPEHLQKYEQFRQQFVDEVVTPIQDELIRSGLVSSDTMDEWNQDMPNWVHLPVDYYSDENVGIGKGVKSRTPIKTITGSMKERVNPLFATILYYNQVLKSAEINTVKRDLLGIVKAYPNEDLWRVQRPFMKTEFDIVSGQYVQKASGPPPANAIPVMNNGKTSWIIINDPQLRKAWEQYGIIENRNIVLRLFAAANKLLYLTAIKLNPDFMVSNAIRDIQTALLNVGSDVDAAGMKRDIAKLWLPSIQAMYKAVRGVPANSNVQRLAYEFMQDGGMMSWADAIPGSLENKVKKINDELLAAERYIGSPRYEQAVKNILPYLWDVFGDAQSSLENAARLATYIASRNAGLSRERAAAVAKNVTVNFHKRGEKSGWLNSIYWLFSASAQSIYRTTSGIARSNRLKIAAGLLVSSSSMLSMYNLSRNPEAVMAIPEHMKATGVIFIGNEGDITYRRLPMAYFWNTFKYAGDVAAQVGLGYMSPADGAKQLWIESLSSINPLGYSEDEKAFLENMIPTIARTPLQVSYNRTWYGGMIYPESEFGWKNKDSETYWDETEPNIKAFTEWLSEATGAESKKNEGAIEISPAAMEYVMKTYLGGPYRTAAGIRKFAGDLETKEFTWEKYPITRIFAGRIQSNAIRSEIVEIIDKGQTNPITKQDVNRFNDLVKMRVFQIAENYKSDPIQAERQLKNLQRQISRFGKLRTLDIASEIFRDKNLQELNDLISQ